uniref:Uncharacterized protein n=1 Tax=Cannabis sativa TaxID=3483 RepID=A0A803QE27_CANSA
MLEEIRAMQEIDHLRGILFTSLMTLGHFMTLQRERAGLAVNLGGGTRKLYHEGGEYEIRRVKTNKLLHTQKYSMMHVVVGVGTSSEVLMANSMNTSRGCMEMC